MQVQTHEDSLVHEDCIFECCRMQSAFNIKDLIFGASRQVHITPLLHSLHWLRVPERIAFRLAVLVYRCLHGTAPADLSADLFRVSDVGPRQRLRSATTSALVGCRTQRSTIGDRAFAAAAPAVWNSLPEEVRSSTLLQLFRRRLKSELFQRSLGPRHFTWLYLNVTWPCIYLRLYVTKIIIIIIIIIIPYLFSLSCCVLSHASAVSNATAHHTVTSQYVKGTHHTVTLPSRLVYIKGTE